MDSTSSSIVDEGGYPVDRSRPIAIEIPPHPCYPEEGGTFYPGDVMDLCRELGSRYRVGQPSAPMFSGFGQAVEGMRSSGFLGSPSTDVAGSREPQFGSGGHACGYPLTLFRLGGISWGGSCENWWWFGIVS